MITGHTALWLYIGPNFVIPFKIGSKQRDKKSPNIISVIGLNPDSANPADKPVIAVPTSVGYGANFGGMTALLSMMNSCAPGVSVVNIDNGFGAGCLASIITQNNTGSKS